MLIVIHDKTLGHISSEATNTRACLPLTNLSKILADNRVIHKVTLSSPVFGPPFTPYLPFHAISPLSVVCINFKVMKFD
jgi:hypothetical protein